MDFYPYSPSNPNLRGYAPHELDKILGVAKFVDKQNYLQDDPLDDLLLPIQIAEYRDSKITGRQLKKVLNNKSSIAKVRKLRKDMGLSANFIKLWRVKRTSQNNTFTALYLIDNNLLKFDIYIRDGFIYIHPDAQLLSIIET